MQNGGKHALTMRLEDWCAVGADNRRVKLLLPDEWDAELTRADADDKPVNAAAYRSKVVLINFWATWCPPCRKEFPSLGRVKPLFKATEFEVLAVTVGEDPDTVLSFASNTGIPGAVRPRLEGHGGLAGEGPTDLLARRPPVAHCLSRCRRTRVRRPGDRRRHPATAKTVRRKST
ncbi:MAG: TlpA family protein disulfide reductase [Dechloromonas sp.]|nr:TlpA family protein disulfide reductase [Candidatus Dechloromonas phosphoritropha]MBP8787549.1 TlpA family protein disulfide reductase [Azonexus sp.]MBP9228097.1 TlpA family protein disulfide reductase [Azonexus sp.]